MNKPLTLAKAMLRGALLGPAYSISKIFFDFPEPFPQLNIFAPTEADLVVAGVSTLFYETSGALLGALF